jgi:hypothetical protein
MHPVAELLETFPESDFAVLAHGFADHGRDYVITTEVQGKTVSGRHELLFTHVVESTCVTQVRDDVWPGSWSDEFTDYANWERAGSPEGYVWGVNWSLAYPGFRVCEPSSRAAEWERRLRRAMYEVTITTDQFELNLVFHSLRTRQINDRTDIVAQVIIPLPE